MIRAKAPRKVALFVCHDLVGLLMLNKVIPALEKTGLQPVIFNTGTHKNRAFRHPSPAIVSAFNVGILEEVIAPFLEKSMAAPNLTYRHLAAQRGLAYAEIKDVNDPAFAQGIAADEDFIGAVSLRFLQVFEAPVITAFRSKGFMWNLHSGLLPGYKGLLTPYRAIDNGETEYGLTLHETVAGLDTGGIIALGKRPLDPRRPVLDLYLDTVDLAAEMLADVLRQIVAVDIPQGTPQRGAGAYYSNPTRDEFLRYMQRGIFYADPVHTVRRIAAAFAIEGTAINRDLTAALQNFLNDKGLAADEIKSVLAE